MISRIWKGPGSAFVCKNAFSTTRILAFKTPLQFMHEKQEADMTHLQFEQDLLSQPFAYNPKVLSTELLDPVTNRPIPINVEMLKYQPLRLPKTHGHLVATLNFRSFHKLNIARAAEFAARAAYYLGIPADGVRIMKTEKRLYTVIKSPFAQAKTKQNFHRVTYALQLRGYDANPEIVDLWLAYINKHKFEDVEYKAELTTRESLDMLQTLDSTTDFSMPEGMRAKNDPIAAKVDELLKSDAFKQFLKE